MSNPNNYIETNFYFTKQDRAFLESENNTFFVSYIYEYEKDGDILVCQRYKGYKNYETFYAMYSQITDIYQKRFNEIIRADSWVESYDIDKWYDDKWTENSVVAIFLEKREAFFITMENRGYQFYKNLNEYRTKNEQVYISSSSTNKKLSFHFTFRYGVYFHVDTMKKIATEFNEYLNTDVINIIEIDLNVYNKNKLMRMIGSCKSINDGKNSRIRTLKKYEKYSKFDDKYFLWKKIDEDILVEHIGIVEPEHSGRVEPVHSGGAEYDYIKELIDIIEPANEYKKWSLLGNALYSISNCDEYFTLWNNWSSTCDNYDQAECVRCWDTMKGRYSLGIIVNYAKNDNLDRFKDIRKKYPYIKKNNDFCLSDYNFTNTSTDEYINSNIFDCDEKVIILKAGLGTGKTTACIDYINNNPNTYSKIIIYTPRITYAKSIINRLNSESIIKDWFLYSVKTKDFYIDKKHVVVQCESLYRCSKVYLDNTLIIIDEVESFLTSLTSKQTHKRHEDTIDLFETLLYSKKVICLDAFITTKTINIFKTLEIPFFDIHYTKKLKQREYIEIKTNGKEDIFESYCKYILNELSLNKKMYLFFSSLTKLKEFKVYVDTMMPTKKYLYYSSDHKIELDNVNDTWIKVDFIMTTSTISVGVNFDVRDYFHSIGVYVSACSRNLIRDVFQSGYRVRHLIDDLMIFAIDDRHNGLNLPVKIDEITANIDNTTQLIIDGYEKYHNNKHPNTENYRWLKNLIIDNTYEYNNSIMNIKEVFFDYLKACNYIQSDTMNDTDTIILEDTELKELKPDYDDIPSINSETMKTIRKQDIKPLEDKLMLEKFFFQQSIEDIDNKDHELMLWDMYVDFGGRSKFRNLRYEKSIVNDTLNMKHYDDIPSINNETFNTLRNQDIKTLEETLMLEKFCFQETIEDIDNKASEWMLWCQYVDVDCRNTFRNVRHEKGIFYNSLNMNSVLDVTMPLIADKMGIQLDVILDLNKWYNIKHSQDVETVIGNDTMQKLIPIFEKHVQRIYTAFDLRPPQGKKNTEMTIKKITTITNSVLSKWGYTKIKRLERKEKTENGKKIQISNYKFEYIDKEHECQKLDIFKNVKYKINNSGKCALPRLLTY